MKDLFGKTLHPTRPMRPPYPSVLPLVPDGYSVITPMFRARYPHLLLPFSFDPHQRGASRGKYSVQGHFDPRDFTQEENDRWIKMKHALEAARPPGGNMPLIELQNDTVQVNFSCFKQPRAVGGKTAPESDNMLLGKWMRAFCAIDTYGAYRGKSNGVLLGLRAYEIIAE